MIVDVAVEPSSELKEKRRKKSRKERRQSGDPEDTNTTHSSDVKSHKRNKPKRDAEEVQNTEDITEQKAKMQKSTKKRKSEDVQRLEAAQQSGPESSKATVPSRKNGKKHKTDSKKVVLEDESNEKNSQANHDLERPGKKHKRKRDIQDTTTDQAPTKRSKSGDDIAQSNAAGSVMPHVPSPNDIQSFLSKHSITIHASSKSGVVTPILTFDQLDVSQDLKSAFAGFKEPTPIQACSWPPALQGQDVVGIAETGSGKTLAFGIPALSRLISMRKSNKADNVGIKVLVMSPTRELAIQTHETLLELGRAFGITSVAVFGGVDKGGQIKALKDTKAKIVVGTPGRIMDLVNDGVCDLSRVTYLVLDEADRMLDRGFENDIRTIIGYAKQGEERQTLMFSATWPEAVRKLASSFQRDPVRVTVGSDDLTANSRVEQVVEVFDDARSKDSRLLGHLRNITPKTEKLPSLDDARVLVFVLYKKEAARVESFLRRQDYSVTGLHGDLSQSARMEALQNFKTGKTRVLVATDVAARGLDIPNVAVVLNYSFPLTIEDYIHRIGRTGRGGKSGKSITFFTGDNHERALAGELARVLRESGFDIEPLKKFPMTIKKKSHGVYGAFYRDDVPVPSGPTKITF